ncbi:MAG: glutamine-hydrolyzing GMP synthase, partial [Chitinivibrionales bacterium]|nr:glutamine-hydrolyzing GMP synthase [Chitinivibrionales bacterium]
MDTIAIVDFGGQYAHLIANRIRRLGVYSAIVPSDVSQKKAAEFKGIILSGSPFSVTDPNRPVFNENVLALPVPILGLCYGHQLMAALLGGTIHKGQEREYGSAALTLSGADPLFTGLDNKEAVWMSHGDSVERPPDGFSVLASTDSCPVAAMGNREHTRYGLQFHPEVTDTPHGMQILENFIALCGCKKEWNSERFLERITEEIKQKCIGKKVFLLVSGGVDSTVAFTLLNKVLGAQRVVGLHIDTGFMRQDESEDILSFLRAEGFLNLHIVNATDTFVRALQGASDPEVKRK